MKVMLTLTAFMFGAALSASAVSYDPDPMPLGPSLYGPEIVEAKPRITDIPEFCDALGDFAENAAAARRNDRPLEPLIEVAERAVPPFDGLVVEVTIRAYGLDIHPFAARLVTHYYCVRAFQ